MNTSPRSQSGFSLLEVLIGASILAIAVLGHSASIFSEQQLSREERARSTAMLATEQFMERLRSDDDFAGLFARLNTFQELSRRSSDAAQLWVSEMVSGYADAGTLYAEDGSISAEANETIYSSWSYAETNLLAVDQLDSTSADFVNLRDGRRAFNPSVFYDDFIVPTGLRALHVAVEVPTAPSGGDVAAGTVLREDLPLARFGLPADLNGDGVIDDASHTDDYRAFPVIVTFHWSSPSGADEELRLSTWVWGYR